MLRITSFALFGIPVVVLLSVLYGNLLTLKSNNTSNFNLLETSTSNTTETDNILNTINLNVNTTSDKTQTPIYTFLRDSTNSKNQAINATLTPVLFTYKVPSGCSLSLHRLIFYLQDGQFIDSGGFGNGLELTNGILINKLDAFNNSVYDYLNGVPITLNIHWNQYGYDLRVDRFASGDESLTIRWTFAKTGEPVNLDENESFALTIRDDLTYITAQRANIQGVLTC